MWYSLRCNLKNCPIKLFTIKLLTLSLNSSILSNLWLNALILSSKWLTFFNRLVSYTLFFTLNTLTYILIVPLITFWTSDILKFILTFLILIKILMIIILNIDIRINECSILIILNYFQYKLIHVDHMKQQKYHS